MNGKIISSRKRKGKGGGGGNLFELCVPSVRQDLAEVWRGSPHLSQIHVQPAANLSAAPQLLSRTMM